jgi:hypothetical protein
MYSDSRHIVSGFDSSPSKFCCILFSSMVLPCVVAGICCSVRSYTENDLSLKHPSYLATLQSRAHVFMQKQVETHSSKKCSPSRTGTVWVVRAEAATKKNSKKDDHRRHLIDPCFGHRQKRVQAAMAAEVVLGRSFRRRLNQPLGRPRCGQNRSGGDVSAGVSHGDSADSSL